MSAQSSIRKVSAADKYLTFVVAGSEYGVGILTVREIIEPVQVSPVPRTPSFISGVINLRGRVIPVVDLRDRFGQGPTVHTDLTVIIVLQYPRDDGVQTFGVLVDEVIEVAALTNGSSAASETPADAGVDSFFDGVGRLKDRVFFLLNLESLFIQAESLMSGLV